MVLGEKSRFYNDINLHVCAIGYNVGEEIDVHIEFLHDSLGYLDFDVKVTLDENGHGVIMSVFKHKLLIVNKD